MNRSSDPHSGESVAEAEAAPMSPLMSPLMNSLFATADLMDSAGKDRP